jgi:preprotein translocase subunit SecB
MSDVKLPTEIEAAAERAGFSGAEYNSVAMDARLQSIQLLKLDLDSRPERMTGNADLSLSYGRSITSCRYDRDTHTSAAIFQYNVTAKSGRSKAFHCNAEYAVVYSTPEDANVEAAMSFAKHVGSFAAYPYFRALAAQMAWNAGIDLPPLPTIATMPILPKPTPGDVT